MYARYDAGRAGLKGRRVPVANMQHGNRTALELVGLYVVQQQ